MLFFLFFLFYLVYQQLIERQAILEQMLIDTTHIDRLRVKFVAHFDTDPDVIAASNEITDIMDNYPREMTSDLRQWLNDQQTNRLIAPLATIDTSKSIEDFQDYINDLEEHLRQLEKNPLNDVQVNVNEIVPFFFSLIIIKVFLSSF